MAILPLVPSFSSVPSDGLKLQINGHGGLIYQYLGPIYLKARGSLTVPSSNGSTGGLFETCRGNKGWRQGLLLCYYKYNGAVHPKCFCGLPGGSCHTGPVAPHLLISCVILGSSGPRVGKGVDVRCSPRFPKRNLAKDTAGDLALDSRLLTFSPSLLKRESDRTNGEMSPSANRSSLTS